MENTTPTTIVWDAKTQLKTSGELKCSGWVNGSGTRWIAWNWISKV